MPFCRKINQMRKLVTVALAATMLLSVTGCSFNRAPESAQIYAPSDGAQVDLANGIKLRNAIYLVDATHTVLVGSLVNSGLEPANVELQYVEPNGQRINLDFNLTPGQKADLGYNGQPAATAAIANAQGVQAKAGDVVKIYLVSAGTSGATLDVPVLDGTLSTYAELLKNLPANTAVPSQAIPSA
jgi:hypothetical protein